MADVTRDALIVGACLGGVAAALRAGAGSRMPPRPPRLQGDPILGVAQVFQGNGLTLALDVNT